MSGQKCDELDLVLYIENELPEPEMLRMESHIARCGECRELLDQHRLVRVALQHAVEVPVPASFSARVMAALPSPLQNFLGTAREKIMALAACITLSVLGAAAYVLGGAGTGEFLSIRHMDQAMRDMLTSLLDVFRMMLSLMRICSDVGLFLWGEISGLLRTIGQVLVFSSPGRAVGMVSLLLFGASLGLYFWMSHTGRHRQEGAVANR